LARCPKVFKRAEEKHSRKLYLTGEEAMELKLSISFGSKRFIRNPFLLPCLRISGVDFLGGAGCKRSSEGGIDGSNIAKGGGNTATAIRKKKTYSELTQKKNRDH
jgi:hypothetical protein